MSNVQSPELQRSLVAVLVLDPLQSVFEFSQVVADVLGAGHFVVLLDFLDPILDVLVVLVVVLDLLVFLEERTHFSLEVTHGGLFDVRVYVSVGFLLLVPYPLP